MALFPRKEMKKCVDASHHRAHPHYRSSWSRDLASEATAPSEVVNTAASWAMERMKITCCLGPLVPVPFSVPRYT